MNGSTEEVSRGQEKTNARFKKKLKYRNYICQFKQLCHVDTV